MTDPRTEEIRARLDEPSIPLFYYSSKLDDYIPIIDTSGQVITYLLDQITAKDAEIARIAAERDRQYDENVNRIAAEGSALALVEAKDAEIDRLRENAVFLQATINLEKTAPSIVEHLNAAFKAGSNNVLLGGGTEG